MQQTHKTLLSLLGLVALMIGLSFASVPLYDLFCRVTGFGGTPSRADAVDLVEGDNMYTVQFNADISQELDWQFAPDERKIEVISGAPFLTTYSATNLSSQPNVGNATFNVLPLQAGKYFKKIACFCFDEQKLANGETMKFPVSFYIDPAIEDDPHLKEVRTITLSYTFFPVR